MFSFTFSSLILFVASPVCNRINNFYLLQLLTFSLGHLLLALDEPSFLAPQSEDWNPTEIERRLGVLKQSQRQQSKEFEVFEGSVRVKV